MADAQAFGEAPHLTAACPARNQNPMPNTPQQTWRQGCDGQSHWLPGAPSLATWVPFNCPIVGAGGYDMIVDDGSHNTQHQMVSIDYLWPAIKPGGAYVIEVGPYRPAIVPVPQIHAPADLAARLSAARSLVTRTPTYWHAPWHAGPSRLLVRTGRSGHVVRPNPRGAPVPAPDPYHQLPL